MKKRQYTFRGIFYAIGMISLALGIILNTKSGLGVAPIVTLSYTVSKLTNLNFSNLTLVIYTIVAIAEYILKGKDFKKYDILQIPMCIAFTRCMNFFANSINLAPTVFWQKILIALIACTFTGIGLALSVGMRLVPNPCDGMVQVISDKTGKNLGLVKNIFDFTFIIVSTIVSLIFAHRVIAIGIGTVIALILTGRIVYLFNRFCMAPFMKLAFEENKTE